MMKKTNGITLVALIITVIVMLILVAVTVSVVINSNLIGTAQNAADRTQIAYESESDVIDNILKDMGIIDWEKAKAEAVAPASQDEERNNGVIGIGTNGEPVDMDLWEYTLMEDGTYGLNDEAGLDDSGAKERSSGYVEKTIENGVEVSNYNSDGTIKGTIPQYISKDNGQTYKPVTSLVHTFYNNAELKVAPKIPETVTNVNVCFYMCENLITAADIPNEVINMNYTYAQCKKLISMPKIGRSVQKFEGGFQGCEKLVNTTKLPDSITDMAGSFLQCKSLKVAPNIPRGVKDIRSAFYECSALESIPSAIPASVTNMRLTFQQCTSLTGTIEINANPTEYSGCFYNVDFVAQNLTLTTTTGSQTVLDALGATGLNYNN